MSLSTTLNHVRIVIINQINIFRHIPDLHGVVLAHSNLQFVSSTATVLGDSPFTRVDISFDATVWSPKTGSRLHGTISISSPDHIALLVHGIFNVSIPRHHIPVDKWVFEYGPSENDPEYGPNAAMALDEAQEKEEEQEENGGRWVDKETGKPLGGKRRSVKFTVIGYVCFDLQRLGNYSMCYQVHNIAWDAIPSGITTTRPIFAPPSTTSGHLDIIQQKE